MSVFRRSTPRKRILDLAQRLAEDYASIPLPEVSRVVQEATATATESIDPDSTEPTGMTALLEEIERVSRRDLDWVRADQVRRKPIRRGRADPAPGARPLNTRRRGVA